MVKLEFSQQQDDSAKTCISPTLYFAKLQAFVYTIPIFSIPFNLVNHKLATKLPFIFFI